ncbi:MAG TPA: fasciclin domain-containing protein [Gaiellaceae bacterium]|nr:fasciclin domain-containing protein [Gaiellaceae bacterium]
MRSVRTTITLLVVAALAAAAIGTSASASTSRPAGDQNIVQTALAAGQFTTLASLLTKAGLVDTLSTGGPFTVFAPTDAAFAKVPKATLDALAANPALLKSVLLYHVVQGRLTAADVAKLSSAKTLDGRSVAIKVADGSVYIDNAKVTTPDVIASNGVIHVIDSVLIPPAAPAAPTRNIVQTAVAAGQFKTLASLLTKAGLVGTLQGKGPFTVFAPTDAAFAKVPKATLAALAKDKAKLRAVLLYHVVKGSVTAAQAMSLSSAKTLNGKPVAIRVSGGKVYVGGAQVVKADVMASNGIIHVINKVLIPPTS